MRIVVALFLLLGLVRPSSAQQDLGTLLGWFQPVEPTHIVGPIYFVGTRGLAAYLIKTDRGHILLDGGMPRNAKDFEASIRKTDTDPKHIRRLLITHAHIDHAGTTAHFKNLSGAKVAVMDRDYEHLKTGGRSDPVYGKAPMFYFPKVKADRRLRNGSIVSFGGIHLKAYLGAGHAQGGTTWVTTVKDGGRLYTVVFPCCTNVNPNIGPISGHRLVDRPSYPRIAEDYLCTFRMLAALKPDIWLGAHTETFDFDRKRARAITEGVQAWVDSDGYQRYVREEKSKFDAILAQAEAASSAPKVDRSALSCPPVPIAGAETKIPKSRHAS